MLPETTEGRVGFVHPYAGVIDVEESSLKILLRDFDLSGLDAKEKMLRDMVAQTAGEVSRREDCDRRQGRLQEHEGSAEGLSGVD